MRVISMVVTCFMVALLSAGIVTGLVLAGEKRTGNSVLGTLVVREASRPAGFPGPSPVGKVELKNYPLIRSASVSVGNVSRNGMFQTLFRHIKQNDIAMTAPVVMQFGERGAEQMEFLYASSGIGTPGIQGDVVVKDTAAMTVVSVGVRGAYTQERFEEQRTLLMNWLKSNRGQWVAVGTARYLAFNSPFVPNLMKYGEVQVPVRAVSADATAQGIGGN